MLNAPSASQNHWFSASNPLTALLPHYTEPEQLASDLAFNPLKNLDISTLAFTEIDELLVGEKTPLEPTTQMMRTALTWHGMLHAGLRRRNPQLAKARQLYWEAVTHKPNGKTHPFSTPSRGISVQVVKGTTGTGKSVTRERFCELFPQVIRHGANSTAGWKAMTQLVYLDVSISHDGSRGGFLINILMQMDLALGTSYAIDFSRKYKSVERLAVATVCRLVAHYTGILFLEEGQLRNLVLGGQAELMQSFLLMLMNSGIPIVFLGNEMAFDWITYSQDTNRLYITPCEHFMPCGAIAMDEESEEDADTDWDAISKGVTSYYCLSIPVSNLKECKQLLRKKSGGIPRLALFLWCMAQRNVLLQGMEQFGPDDIAAVYNSSIFAEHKDLADGFAFRKSDLLLNKKDVDVSFYEAHWQSGDQQGADTVPPTQLTNTSAAADAGKDKPRKTAKETKSEQAKFKAEQTRKKNKDNKRSELSQSLPKEDIRNAGLTNLHMKGLRDALTATRGAQT